MPNDPRIYSTKNAPATANQGDLLFDEANNTIRVFTGSSWVQFRSTSLTLTDAASEIVPGATSFAVRNNADSANNLLVEDAGDVTVRRNFIPSAGFTAQNAATPAWYIPGASGNPSGAVASLANRAAVYWDTAGSRLWARFSGSWFASPSFILGG